MADIDTRPVTAVVHVYVRPECLADFIALTRMNSENSKKEPGNLRFDVLQSAADPCEFLLYEMYRTAEDSAAHKQTAHYAAWREGAEPMMAKPRHADQFRAECW